MKQTNREKNIAHDAIAVDRAGTLVYTFDQLEDIIKKWATK